MNKENAKKLFEKIKNECLENIDLPETKIRSGVNKMLACMWQVYWKCWFEGEAEEVYKPDRSIAPLVGARKMWHGFAEEQRCKWLENFEKLKRFGRDKDAAKEKIKLEQLEKICMIFNQEVS